jgi:hypothetical protein
MGTMQGYGGRIGGSGKASERRHAMEGVQDAAARVMSDTDKMRRLPGVARTRYVGWVDCRGWSAYEACCPKQGQTEESEVQGGGKSHWKSTPLASRERVGCAAVSSPN